MKSSCTSDVFLLAIVLKYFRNTWPNIIRKCRWMWWHIHTQGLEVRQSLFNNFPSGLSAALRVGWNDRMAACHYCQLTPKLSSVWAIATAWLGGVFFFLAGTLGLHRLFQFPTFAPAGWHTRTWMLMQQRQHAQMHNRIATTRETQADILLDGDSG